METLRNKTQHPDTVFYNTAELSKVLCDQWGNLKKDMEDFRDSLVKSGQKDDVVKMVDTYLIDINRQLQEIEKLSYNEILRKIPANNTTFHTIKNMMNQLVQNMEEESKNDGVQKAIDTTDLEQYVDKFLEDFDALKKTNEELVAENKLLNKRIVEEQQKYNVTIAKVVGERDYLKSAFLDELKEWDALKKMLKTVDQVKIKYEEGENSNEKKELLDIEERVEVNLYRINHAIENDSSEVFREKEEFVVARHLLQERCAIVFAARKKANVRVEINMYPQKQEEDDFEALRDEEQKFSPIAFLRKNTAVKAASIMAIVTTGVLAANAAIRKIHHSTVPQAHVVSQKKVVAKQKNTVPVSPVVKKVQAPVHKVDTQKVLSVESTNAMNRYILKDATIGSYANGTVYTKTTINKVLNQLEGFVKQANKKGSIKRIVPVGFFYGKDGTIKKVYGQKFANGNMGVTSPMGPVPMSFALEVTTDTSDTLHAGLGTITSSVLPKTFSAPEITTKTVQNPHKDLHQKVENIKNSVGATIVSKGGATSMLEKVANAATSIKDRFRKFFG